MHFMHNNWYTCLCSTTLATKLSDNDGDESTEQHVPVERSSSADIIYQGHAGGTQYLQIYCLTVSSVGDDELYHLTLSNNATFSMVVGFNRC